jgi:hypothetical protein
MFTINIQMMHTKSEMLCKILVGLSFIIVLFFSSCNKSSEKAEENVPVSNQQNSEESADTNIIEEVPSAIETEAEEEKVPVLESIVPEQIRRPQQGEAPRFPEDIIIGTLGAGDASLEAFLFAQEKLRELLQEDFRQDVLSILPPEERERIISILQELNPKKVRVGGGRNEADESVSFLFRMIGTSNWSGGEIYIRQNEDTWNMEDLILDDSREQDEENNPYRFNLPPYERFF